MNNEQKKLLRDRLTVVSREPHMIRRRNRDRNRSDEPRRIKLIRKRIQKLDKALRVYDRQLQAAHARKWRPVQRAIDAANSEIYFGSDAKKALALVVRAEKLSKEALR